ncbi:MAG: hypothetical protein ACKVG7_02265 [Flavobacteriales bacterium]
MKKLLIVLLCLFSLNTLTYASFPITENYTETLESIRDNDPDNGPPSLFILIFPNLIFVFGLYFLIRAWWRAWKDDVKWVKILTYILLVSVLLILLIASFSGGLVGGFA